MVLKQHQLEIHICLALIWKLNQMLLFRQLNMVQPHQSKKQVNLLNEPLILTLHFRQRQKVLGIILYLNNQNFFLKSLPWDFFNFEKIFGKNEKNLIFLQKSIL